MFVQPTGHHHFNMGSRAKSVIIWQKGTREDFVVNRAGNRNIHIYVSMVHKTVTVTNHAGTKLIIPQNAILAMGTMTIDGQYMKVDV